MELLSLVCLFVLAWSARTLGDETGPDVIKIYVKEDDDIILPCSIRPEIITDKGFDWKRDGKDVYLYDGQPAGQDGQAKGRISPFPDQIKTGNASIKIINAKVADSGNYTCYIASPPPAVFPPQSQIELTVDCILKDRTEEKIPGTCRRPNIRIINPTNDGTQVQCKAENANPKPELELQDSAGVTVPAENIQFFPKGDNFDVILFATVIKADNYHCVVRQRNICHEVISEETHVLLPEFPTGWAVAAIIFGLLLVGAVLYILVSKGVIKLKSNKDIQGPTSISSNSMQPSDQDSKQPLNV